MSAHCRRRKQQWCLLTALQAWLRAALVTLMLAKLAHAADNPRLVLQSAHAQTVTAMAIDPRGKWMATGGEDGAIGVWDLQTGYRVHTLSGHLSAVTALHFGVRQSGMSLVSIAAHNAGVRSWTISDDGKVRPEHRDMQWMGMVTALDAAGSVANGTTVAVSGTDGLAIWSMDAAAEPLRLALPQAILRRVVVSPLGRSVATLSQTGELKQWFLHKLKEPTSKVLYSEEGDVEFMRFTKAGQLFVLRSSPRVFQGATAASPQLVFDVYDAQGSRMSSTVIRGKCVLTPLAVSDGGKIAAVMGSWATFSDGGFSSGSDATDGCQSARLALVQPGVQPATTVLDVAAEGLAVAAFDDGATTLGLGYRNGNVIRVRLGQRDSVPAVLAADALGTGGLEAVVGLALLEHGKTLAVAGGKQLTVWDLERGRPRQVLATANRITALTSHPEAGVFAVGEENGRVSLRNSHGEQLYQRDLDGRDPRLALSKDGKKLAVGFDSPATGRSHALLSLIDFSGPTGATQGVLRRLPPVRHGVTSLAFNDAASLLASGHMAMSPDAAARPLLRLWNTATRTERVTPLAQTRASVLALQFQPHGSVLAIGSGEGLRKEDQNFVLWDASNGRFKHTDADLGINNAIAISPSGKRTAVGSVRVDRASVTIHTMHDEFRPEGVEIDPGTLPPPRDPRAGDPPLVLWNTDSGSRLASLEGHGAAVSALAFNGEQQLLSASIDGTVGLWPIPTGNVPATSVITPSATILHFREPGAWLVTHSDGRFDTDNLDRLRGLAWVFADDPLRAFPAEIFMRDFYTPGLLAQLTHGCRSGPCKAPLSNAIATLNRVQPRVAITAVRPGRTASEVLVDVTATGNHDPSQRNGKQKTGVYDLRLFRNGQLVGQFPAPGGSSRGPQSLAAWRTASRLPGAVMHTFSVQLPQNSDGSPIALTAYAFNEDRVKSATASWADFTAQTGAAARKPRAYVITIGVDSYGGQVRDLAYAVKDARDMNAALTRINGYDVISLMLLSGALDDGAVQQATKINIRDAIGILAGKAGARERLKSVAGIDKLAVDRLDKATPDDLVILSFSGHGYAAPSGDFYLLPSGPAVKDPLAARQLDKLISSEDLATWLRDVDAGQLAVIIDACHAAASVDVAGFKPGPLGDKGFGQLAYDKGMLILAATQASDVALEVRRLRQGLLTYALTQAALAPDPARPTRRHADLNGNGQLTLSEWLRYGESQVPLLYAAIRANRLPQVRRDAFPADPAWRQKVGRDGQKPTLFDFRKNGSDAVLLPTPENGAALR